MAAGAGQLMAGLATFTVNVTEAAAGT